MALFGSDTERNVKSKYASWQFLFYRVATVREKYLEDEIFSRSGKSQGILWMDREKLERTLKIRE